MLIDVLLRRAFPHGQWSHVRDYFDQQEMAAEVRVVLDEALVRNGV